MKPFVCAIALLLAGASPWAAARPPEQRSIDAARASLPARAGRWVLIVVDAHRLSSDAYLAALRQNGYEGTQATVLVVGESRTAAAFSRRTHLLPQAQWTVASAAARGLKLKGLPVVLGIDGRRQIAWQEAGQPLQPSHLAVRIADWVAAAAAPPAH